MSLSVEQDNINEVAHREFAIRTQAQAAIRRGRLRTGMVRLGDLAALASASLFFGLGSWALIGFLTLNFAFLTGSGLSKRRVNLRVTDDITALGRTIGIASMIVALIVDQHRYAVMGAALLAWGLTIIARGVVYRSILRARRLGTGLEPTVIIGAGKVGQMLAETLIERPEYGLDPVGFVDTVTDSPPGLPLLGTPHELPDLLERLSISRLIFTYGRVREADLVSMMRRVSEQHCTVHLVPRFFELSTYEGARIDDIWGFPLLQVRASATRVRTWPLKRAFDMAGAAILLLVLSPVLAACALAVRLSGPGPVLFRQKRIGVGGAVIEILKFRTMRVNDDSDTQWSVDEDDRVTRIGRILRPTHLDELPQLINVIRGDMSLVGPRPERSTFVDQFSTEIDGYADRHRVKGGITGWAQVNGLWGDTSIGARARLDNRYIEDWSIWRDIVILMRTIPTVLGRREK